MLVCVKRDMFFASNRYKKQGKRNLNFIVSDIEDVHKFQVLFVLKNLDLVL